MTNLFCKKNILNYAIYLSIICGIISILFIVYKDIKEANNGIFIYLILPYIFTTAFMIAAVKMNNNNKFKKDLCTIKMPYKVTLIAISAVLFFLHIFMLFALGILYSYKTEYATYFIKTILLIPIIFLVTGAICNMYFLYYLSDPNK